VGARTPIGEAIKMVSVFHNRGDYANRNVEISKLSMLVKDLQTIGENDQVLLNEFKRKLHDTSKNWGTYFGVRMEINVAASLLRKHVKFVKQESPDFAIPEYGVFIECGSSHKPDDSSADIGDKIRTTITEKSRKAYCNLATLLCMDITNIAAKCGDGGIEILASKNSVHRMVKQILSDTNPGYGSILLFLYFMDTNESFHSSYWRTDNDTITPALLAFLDKHYPYGDFKSGPEVGIARAG
jgi:hypothetical protein